MKSRREIIQLMPFAAAAVLAACGGKPADTTGGPAPAPAAEPTPPEPAAAAPAPAAAEPAGMPLLDEADPVAAALGYVADAARVDTARHPNFVAGSLCANCNLFSGTAGSEAGPCSLFPGKQVSAAGWCASYVKKPA
jgi:hypothetical protein